jgi:6,7-dimethyl-8-ribityllumazine synthase
MNGIQEIAGAVSGVGRRFGVVASRFNERVVDALLQGAVDCLLRHGVAPADLRVVRVPGAWEIPGALAELAAPAGDPEAGFRPHGLVALGAVIRGETSHYDVICDAASRGSLAVAERFRVPVGFGVLTCETSAQAEERAGGKAGNKGWDAALAALEMADLYAKLRG